MAIHTVNRDTIVGYSIVAFARVAVPFFFISSGYFYYDKLQISNTDTKKKKIISHLKKLTKIYVLWSAVYFIIDNTLIKNVVKIVRYFFVIGIHAHLWFLSALIVCTLIISLIYFRWRINLKYLFGGSIILYLVAAAGDMYSVFFDSEIIYRAYNIYNNFFGETWNSFMAGLIFFYDGNAYT